MIKKIAITLPYFFAGEAQEITRMLDTGEYWRVHIRKPDATEKEMRDLIEAIPEGLRSRISLHDYHELAEEYSIGGVHINRRNPNVPVGWNGLVSKSLHSIAEIGRLADEDYAFLSPIYPSISKPGYQADFDFTELHKAVNKRIFALGGVTKARLSEIESLGFGGAAMLGDAWKANVDIDRFRLQFITHCNDKYDTVTGARAALAGGCKWIQLRMKGGSIEQILAAAKEISVMCKDAGATFIIDDHVELINETGADGVHLGKNDMPVDEARRLLGPKKIIGATANCYADIEKAYNQGANYIGLGPFRFTTTKSNLSPILGVEGYEGIMRECHENGINIPIVAIGGITVEDIFTIMSTGVSGIALSGSILNAPAPTEATREIINEISNSINHK
ncbi:MAG: thiamine phosphate synthase [Muribaculaceae bacterium]|nr:thiamine phosphate synthase [Muribaculaceae bacterium]